jgi:hypothetical protein
LKKLERQPLWQQQGSSRKSESRAKEDYLCKHMHALQSRMAM